MHSSPWIRDYMTNGVISVRKYHIGDALALYEAVNESSVELTRWGFYHPFFTIQDAEKDVISRITDWNEGKAYTFLIEMLPGPIFVGNCRVEEFEPEIYQAALGWWVRTSRTRKGIATAAVRFVAQAAFEDLHLSSLNIYAKVNNIPSRRVAEKVGAVLVRIKPEDDGSFCAVYELKPESLV